MIVQTVVSLINLAGRRLGLDPASAGERDLEQARDGIDGARALMPVLERASRRDAGAAARGALGAPAALREARRPAAAAARRRRRAASRARPAARAGEAAPADAGPAQRSGRLWVPGS